MVHCLRVETTFIAEIEFGLLEISLCATGEIRHSRKVFVCAFPWGEVTWHGWDMTDIWKSGIIIFFMILPHLKFWRTWL